MRTIIETAYFTDKIDEMAAFYQQVLDCEPSERAKGLAAFQTGTTRLFLHQNYTPGEGELSPEPHLAVAVRDVDATCKLLEEKGIHIEILPGDYYWGRSAYLRDPDGHQVEIHESPVDWAGAHPFFAAHCFNTAWDYIDKPNRTPEEDEMMINLTQASIWHWKQRPDCTATNLSVGYWQAARVYALVNQVENARRYGQLCLEITPRDLPFYMGYAYEALARAEMTAGNMPMMQEYLQKARNYAAQVPDEDDRKYLESDLETIQ